MAHSTPKFSFQSTPKSNQSYTGQKPSVRAPKAETILQILNYSKALEGRKGISGEAVSYVLN